MIETTMQLKLKITTEINFWQALKLRIAGAKYIHEYIQRKLEEERTVRYPTIKADELRREAKTF